MRLAWTSLLLLICCAATAAGTAVAAGPTASVSLGDSFVSGQAGRWQGNSNELSAFRGGTDRACVPQPLGCRYDVGRVYLGGTAPPGCARSDVAPIRSADFGVQREFNIACSGATTNEIFRAAAGGKPFKGELPQADQLARIARENTVRQIVLSVGGNDIGFTNVVVACVLAYATRAGPCEAAQRAAVDAKLPAALGGVAKAIGEIRAVMRSAGYRPWNYRLVLQSYPSPIPRAAENRYSESGLQRSTTGGCPFYDSDSNWARNVLVPLLDENLRSVALVTGAQFLSLRDSLQGREICSKSTRLADSAHPPSATTSDWARAIGVNPILQGQGIDEEAHPNAYGQLALGRCLTLLSSRATGSWACRNTPGRGTDGMALTQISSSPERYRMSLRVSPRRVRAGRRRCFRFRVLSGGQPVERARIRFAGTRGRTNSRGRLRKCARLRARRYRARASRSNFRSVSVIVRGVRRR